MNLKAKLFYSLLSFLMLISCIAVLLFQHLQFLQTAERRQLQTLYDTFIAEINSKGETALSIAGTLASQPLVAAALNNQQRDLLVKDIADIWQMLELRYDVRQLQFHTSNAESFLRMHAPQNFGDSLRDFRFTVVRALESQRPVSGLEHGVYGIGIRGVVPVFSKDNNQVLGSVEIGFAFDQAFIDSFNAKYNADVSVFLVNDNLSLLATTLPAQTLWPDFNSALTTPQYWRSKLSGTNYAHFSFKLQDFSDAAIGVVDVAIDRAFYQKAAIAAGSLATMIVFIALLLTYFLNKTFFRLKHKSEQARLQQVELNKTEHINRSMLGYIVEKEKMASLGQIVSGVAHEINTPLGVAVTANSCNILAAQELHMQFQRDLLKKSCLSDYLQSTIKSNTLIEFNLSRMSSLIDKFKSLAVGKHSKTEHVFCLKTILESVSHSLESACTEGHLTVVNAVDDHINIQDSALEFINIISHMILNTLQHGLNAPEETTLRISATLSDNVLTISSEDNGPGISEENLRHVFEPFFTTARNKACTGLGLSIMYNVITQKYSGSITAVSPALRQQGFKLIIKLPVNTSSQNGQSVYVISRRV